MLVLVLTVLTTVRYYRYSVHRSTVLLTCTSTYTAATVRYSVVLVRGSITTPTAVKYAVQVQVQYDSTADLHLLVPVVLLHQNV